MSRLFRCFRATGIALLVALTVLGTVPAASAAEIVVFAAASLKEALDDAAHVYENQSGDTMKISYAASSTLAKQIESGALPKFSFRLILTGWITYNNAISLRRRHAGTCSETGSSSSPPKTAI